MLKFNYPEDYSGDNLDQRVVNETRTIDNAVARLITPDYGTFFANDTLNIHNTDTNRDLVKGKDYDFVDLDVVATEKSGKPCFKTIRILNKQVANIEYDYRFVGGSHMSGLHLINEIKKIYPRGLEATYHYDKVINKPEAYTAKPHTMHVKDLYGFDGISQSLDRMIKALGFKSERNINQSFDKVMAKLDGMEQDLNSFITDNENNITNAFDSFKVQESEYIFTDSLTNPSISRGYGNWVLVKNTILKGDNLNNSYVVGGDSVIALGTKQYARNCYLWKNQTTNKRPTYKVTCLAHSGLPATQRYENQEIEFTIQTTGLAVGNKINWMLIDDQTQGVVDSQLVEGLPVGEVVIDAAGLAKVKVKFKPNTTAAQANRNYTFRLTKNVDTKFSFTVIDTSLEKRIALRFTQDVAGKYPLSNVAEGDVFYLQVDYIGNWLQGEIMVLNWNYGGIDPKRIKQVGSSTTPHLLNVPSTPKETIALVVDKDELTDVNQTLIVYGLVKATDLVDSATAYASLDIRDTSNFSYANISFNDLTNKTNNVARVDEGVDFAIVIDTNLPNTELNVAYQTTKSIDDFSNLLSTVTTNSAGRATINAKTLADFLTNVGAQSLTVRVDNSNVSLGSATLFINDTSKSPDYTLFFSTQDINKRITEIDEGEKFFLNIKVDNWQQNEQPPSLVLAYRLNDKVDTATAELVARIQATFYEAMVFGPNASVYNGVSWVNGNTLRFEMTAIADQVANGDAKFTVLVRQSNQASFGLQSSLTIRDTSVPTVVATWSSSSTVLTPLTRVNEMTATGTNQRFYLWVDIEGNGGSFGTITFNSNSINDVDLVTTFPRTAKLADGASRYILTLDAKADFIEEGDKDIFVSGSYKGSDGRDIELFKATITLVDNSTMTDIEAKTSTSNTQVIQADAFSEWVPFYAHLNFPAFAFDTQVEWRAVFTSNPSGNEQLEVKEGVVDIAKNTAKGLITLTPIKDRLKDGEAVFTLMYRRKVKATGQYITLEKSLTGIRILDDSQPMSLELKIYTDAARTKLLSGNIDEGEKLYLRAIVSNPDKDYSIAFAINDLEERNPIYDVTFLTPAGIPRKVLLSDRVIVKEVSYSSGPQVINVDAEMTIVADREANPVTVKNYALAMVAKAYDNSNKGYPQGSTIATSDKGVVNSSIQEFLINDASRKATYILSGSAFVNEGEFFELKLAITSGTKGDVYYLRLRENFDTSRLSINELGLEQLSVVTSDELFWKFQTTLNHKTDGETRFVVECVNKTTGQVVSFKDVTVKDTSTEANLGAGIVGSDGWTTTLGEGLTGTKLGVYAINNQIDEGEIINIEWVSGRAKNLFPVGTWGNHTAKAPDSHNNPRVTIPFYVPMDRFTNPENENQVTIKVTAFNSGVSKEFTFPIADRSQTPGFKSLSWVGLDGESIANVREGDTAILRVLTLGGFDPFNVTLTNDGGRTRLSNTVYGTKKSRVNDTTVLEWRFDVARDNMDNSGPESMLKVKLTEDVFGTTAEAVLPIIDNSRASAASVEFHTFNTTDVITKVAEGSKFGVKYIVSSAEEGERYRLLTRATGRVDTDWTFNAVLGSEQLISEADGSKFHKVNLSTAPDKRVAPLEALKIIAEVWDDNTNKLIGTNSLEIVDVYLPDISSVSIRICAPSGNTHLSSVNEGSSVDVVLSSTCFANTDWTKQSMRMELLHMEEGGGVLRREVRNITSEAQLLTDGSIRFSIAVPADETTNLKEQWLYVELYHVFNELPDTVMFRGESQITKVNDTSQSPSIDEVFLSLSGDPSTATPATKFDEGESFYLHVKATALMAGGSSTSVNLAWSGTATNADFDKPLPSDITLNMLGNGTGYKYAGVEGPYKILEDNIQG